MVSTTTPILPETYEVADSEGIARIYEFLAEHEGDVSAHPAQRYLLSGAGEQVELPEEVYLVLRQVVESMRRGLSVTISPVSKTLTTQQAADLLGVSRPTIIKILDEGKVPFERTGTHRRIKLSDLLEFRSRRREEQYAALAALSTEIDEETPLKEILTDLKSARRAVAAKRRASTERA